MKGCIWVVEMQMEKGSWPEPWRPLRLYSRRYDAERQRKEWREAYPHEKVRICKYVRQGG